MSPEEAVNQVADRYGWSSVWSWIQRGAAEFYVPDSERKRIEIEGDNEESFVLSLDNQVQKEQTA